jgi:peptidoglycan L-alanyl-D-glutamate endopeptidase CwlK
MVNSRDTMSLSVQARAQFELWQVACRNRGVEIAVTSTYRDAESQDDLYAQGRTKPGRIVTKAKGWSSWHQYRCAWDAYPDNDPDPHKIKPEWSKDDPRWLIMFQEARALGIECGADWKWQDFPHFQYRPSTNMSLVEAKELFDAQGTLFA